MSTTITQAQLDWTQTFTGVNLSGKGAAANGATPNGAEAAAPGAGGAPGGGVPGAQTSVEVADAKTDAALQKALQGKKWADAAKALESFSKEARQERLAKLPANVVSKIHDSAVAADPSSHTATDIEMAQWDNDLDAGLNKAIDAKKWSDAAKSLDGYTDAGLRQRLSKLPPESLTELHKAAAKNNPSSPTAVATEVLAHPTLGSDQKGRASELEKKLSPKDKEKYDGLIKDAKSDTEKQYITKGLAANHKVADLEAFAAKIKGKDAKWLQDNLSMTGDSTGSGVKQQWHTSCGPTTYEAVLGEMDPIYALKMHEDNPDLAKAEDSKPTEMNPKMAGEQRKMLNDAGSSAQSRASGAGQGMWIADNLNKVSATTGLEYKKKTIGDGLSVDDGLKALNDATSKGRPVPMIIGDGNTAQGGNAYGHYVLVTASDPGPPRYYKIHDPDAGKTVTRSEDQIRKGQIDIAGWNKFGGIDEPSEAPKK